MSDDTRQGIRGARGDQDWQGQLAELGLPLEELVRRGARDILQRAIEAEVQVQLDKFASVSLIDGRRAVVRNGYLPARAILTTVGPVEVQVPKVRDRSGSGVKFNSALAPPYVRRSARIAAALPWLYLKGISSGDLGEALEVLVGEGAKGLSPAALGRLKAQWSEEYKGWAGRSLKGQRHAYWWVDGIYTPLRQSDDPKLCLLVIIGVTADGTKEWVAISDGLRESTESWLDVLRDLKERGLEVGPRLAVGDGALGFWKALDQVRASALLVPQAGQRPHRFAQVPAQQGDALGLVQLAQIAPHRILAHDLAHPQQRGVDGVAPQGADVGVALMPGEDRQHRGAQYISIARRIGAGEHQRTALDPGSEEAAHLKKFGEERQLAERGDGRLRVPLDVDSAPKGIHRHRARVGHQRGAFALTRWVTVLLVHMCLLAALFQRLTSGRARSNCSF